MKKCLALVFTLALVLGYTAAQVEARGGGGHGGGGHHGGGEHHAGGHPGGGTHHAAGHHNANHHHSNVPGHYAHHNGNHHHPFTPGWYGNHPGAWGSQYGGWGYGGVGGYGGWWGATTYGAAASWMGMSALGAGGGYAYPGNTVYTGDNGTTGQLADTATPQADAAVANISPLAGATTLAQQGAIEPAKDATFLPLGVYTMAPENHPDASVMMQLAVTKDGVLRGTYYDLVSDSEKTIQGSVDKQTQRVAWTVGNDGQVVFETKLADLTGTTGPVALHYQNGQFGRWTMARMQEAPEGENEKEVEVDGTVTS